MFQCLYLFSGQLLHPDVSTSLHYRSFLTAEMFVFDLKMHYPRQWNALQTWDLDINLPKVPSVVCFHTDKVVKRLDHQNLTGFTLLIWKQTVKWCFSTNYVVLWSPKNCENSKCNFESDMKDEMLRNFKTVSTLQRLYVHCAYFLRKFVVD